MHRVTLILILLLLLPGVSAEVFLEHNVSIQPRATFVIPLNLNILSTPSDNSVILKRNNVEVPFEHGIKRLGPDFYLYGIAPTAENNYTITISSVELTQAGQPTTSDITIPLIVRGSPISYNIKPALIDLVSKSDLVITSFNDDTITIPTKIPGRAQIDLVPGENVIRLNTEELRYGLNSLEIGTTQILVYVTPPTDQTISRAPIRFFPSRLQARLLVSDKSSLKFKIINFGSLDLEDVDFEYDSDLFTLKPTKLTQLEPNETAEVEIQLRSRQKTIDENIRVTFNNESYDLPIYLEFTTNVSDVLLPGANSSSTTTRGYYCLELGGKQCSQGESCSVSTVPSLDIPQCCPGTCVKPTTSSGYAWIGYLIAAVVLIVLVIVGGRYLKTRKQIAPSLTKGP